MNNIILYHGTIYDIKYIEINKGKGYKDFGKGFYTTRIKSHAEIRNKKIGKNIKFTPYIYEYEFNIDNISNLHVKEFKKADIEWIDFVLSNRSSERRIHNYDIVIGPTADDDTRLTIEA